MKKRKNSDEKKVLEEENKIDPKLAAAIKTIEKTLPQIDKDLAQFVACSALSVNSLKMFNTFTLCYQVYHLRNTIKHNKTLSKDQISQDEWLWLTAVDGLLGSKAPLN